MSMAALELSCASAPAVAITGWAMRTPLGGTRDTWDALVRGEFIRDHARVPVAYEPGARRAVRLAVDVARECWQGGDTSDSAVVVGTSKGPVEAWLAEPPQQDSSPLPHISISPYVAGGLHPAGLAELSAAIASDLGITGPRLTFSAACASGLHALIRGAMMIRAREVRRVLVVAAESSVHPLFLGSFQRLGVLPKAGVGCRPFDRGRDGFLMSEAAAAVLLEAREPTADTSTNGPGSSVLVERFAMGGDATHITAGDPAGRLLRHLLARVLDGRPVDLVHAHGTGTIMNDAMELAAIEDTLCAACDPPSLYSHKGALGHSLGAAGLIAVALNCEMHGRGLVPPNCQTHDPLPHGRVLIDTQPRARPISRSIALAAGFGGAMAVVSLASR